MKPPENENVATFAVRMDRAEKVMTILFEGEEIDLNHGEESMVLGLLDSLYHRTK